MQRATADTVHEWRSAVAEALHATAYLAGWQLGRVLVRFETFTTGLVTSIATARDADQIRRIG